MAKPQQIPKNLSLLQKVKDINIPQKVKEYFLPGKTLEEMSEGELREYVDALEEANTDLINQLHTATSKIILVPSTKKPAVKQADDLYVYVVNCAESVAFTDTEKHTFEKFVLVTRRPWEEEFSFSEMTLYFDDVDLLLDSQAGAAWFVILDWITKDLPVIMSVFTEKDCEEYIDVNIDAQGLKSIKERALTRMYFNNRAFLKRFDQEIEELEAWNEASKKKIHITNQKIEDELAQIMDDPFSPQKKGLQLKKWQVWLLGAGWVVAAIMFAFLV